MTTTSIDDILQQLKHLQEELEDEIDKLLEEKRLQFRYTLNKGKVRFEASIKKLQRYHKVGIFNYLRNARLGHLVSAPIIYCLIIPFLMLDIMITIYQTVCFRVYEIPRVQRKDYFLIDRQQLGYLNIIEKMNCIYCGYCNAVIEYVREIAAKTEQYWCPIKHASRTPDPHRYVERFVDFGDADAYKSRLKELQEQISEFNNDKQSQANDNTV